MSYGEWIHTPPPYGKCMGIFPTTVWEMYGKCMGNSPTTVWVASPRPYESNHVDSSLLNSYAIHTPGMGKIFSDE